MKNDYKIQGDKAIIFINGLGKSYETIIDIDDLPVALSYEGKWYADFNKSINGFYVRGSLMRKRKKVLVYLHRFLSNDPQKYIDHINHNTLDNRKSNLRPVTHAENVQNRKNATKSNNSSGIRGVSWNKNKQKWQVQVNVNKKRVYSGYFGDLNEAESAAKEARRKYMPFSQEALEDRVS